MVGAGRYIRSDGTGVESVFGYVSEALDLMVSRLVTTQKSMEVQTIISVARKMVDPHHLIVTVQSQVMVQTPPMVFRY